MNQELGFFYDTIHGRISLGDLPTTFHPALKAVLSSPALDRLKRISQLGHTSLSYFSATHTRFSHALGTMLVMNKVFKHIRNRTEGLASEVFTEIETPFKEKIGGFINAEDFIYCHLLLAALYQDAGELPFQKITSHFFRPAHDEVQKLQDKLRLAKPTRWEKSKNVFSLLAILNDSEATNDLGRALDIYSLDFLAFLITGDGCPNGCAHLKTLRQMVDAAIDADRLDYVYRDASVTIGSLSRPTTVLETIVAYKNDQVVVSDPRPIVDFLSTRMRLWTFVYSAPDVRFRQALLKTFLQGRFDYPASFQHFATHKLGPVLSYEDFLVLDDYSIMSHIEQCYKTGKGEKLKSFRLKAANLLLKNTLEYECRILEQPDSSAPTPEVAAELVAGLAEPDKEWLPDDLFFDLFRDHNGLQLHRNESIMVQQSLTDSIDGAEGKKTIAIERTSGALSPLFSEDASALLVPKSFYVFRPRKKTSAGGWPEVDTAIADKSLYWRLRWAEARRAVNYKTDTRDEPGFDTSKTALSISYCSTDFDAVAPIVQELYEQKWRYRLFLKPFDGTGNTSVGNSANLIDEATAVLVLASVEYLKRAKDKNSHIGIEVERMRARAVDIPVIVLGLDARTKLETVSGLDWGNFNAGWTGQKVVIADIPLREASDFQISYALSQVLTAIKSWKP